jgi:hypothetical protein
MTRVKREGNTYRQKLYAQQSISKALRFPSLLMTESWEFDSNRIPHKIRIKIRVRFYVRLTAQNEQRIKSEILLVLGG